ncbi:S1 family peptidase [Goodfellowiella coeruleoviolacea]|uniref:S1 family peptidase n=1 Tax=Goodfellowiella coeruleoviolacea TaxID=334858 RepID=UPI0020A3B525|nr:S1 family peptidase [Goodfellowiella coeruleoviolacea]
MQRKILLRISASVLLAASVGVGTTLAPASAAPDTALPELSAGVLPAMQRDLGLTEQQARTRLLAEAAAAEVAPAAQQAAGEAFGGAWFDADQGALVVGLTDQSKAEAVRATGARTTQVARTEADLAAVKARIDEAAQHTAAPASVHSWRTDPRSGSVVISVRAGADDQELDAFLDRARQAGPVTVERTTAPRPETFAAGTVGGDPYYINGNVRCSIGFSVQGGFVSAGHCGTAGASVSGWDGSAMGSFAGSSFPGNDYSFIRIGNGWWTVPVVLGWGTVSDVLVRGSREAAVGTSVCRSGSTTHWHCGTILAKNETVNYSQGAVYGMTKTSVCAEGGDSGGSFISGDQAQGMTSGGWGNCSSGGETWFQPVNEALSVYGVSLVTA